MRGTASRYKNQEMLQELFSEINEYLGDQNMAKTDNLPANDLHIRTADQDIDREFKIQLTEQSPQPSLLKSERPILVESCCDSESEFDKTSIATREFENFSRPLSATSKSQTPRSILELDRKPSVCMCYKCKKERPLINMHSSSDKVCDSDYVCIDCQDRPQSRSRSWSTAGNGLRFAAIGDIVKQTLSSTPLDILPLHRESQPRNKKKQQKQRMKRPKSLPSMHAYTDQGYQEELGYDPKVYEKKRTRRSSTKSMFYDHRNDSGYTITKHDDTGLQQDCSTEESVPNAQVQAYYDSVEPCMAQSNDIQDQNAVEPKEAPTYYKEAALAEETNAFDRNRNLPFLTPSDRTGEVHQGVSVRDVRQMSSREDRMAAYNNAYYHCIYAETNMIPWLQKQYNKGPPDAMFDYIPRPKKAQKSLFSKLKRCAGSKKQTKESSVSLHDNLSRSMVTLSNHISLNHQLSASVSPAPNAAATIQQTLSPAPMSSTPHEPELPETYKEEYQKPLLQVPDQAYPTPGKSASPRPIMKHTSAYEQAEVQERADEMEYPVSRVPSVILDQRRRTFEGDLLPSEEIVEEKRPPSRPRSSRRRRSSHLRSMKYGVDGHLVEYDQEFERDLPDMQAYDDSEDIYLDTRYRRRRASSSYLYPNDDRLYMEEYPPEESYKRRPYSMVVYPHEPLIYENERRSSYSRHPPHRHCHSPSGKSNRRAHWAEVDVVTFKEPVWDYE